MEPPVKALRRTQRLGSGVHGLKRMTHYRTTGGLAGYVPSGIHAIAPSSAPCRLYKQLRRPRYLSPYKPHLSRLLINMVRMKVYSCRSTSPTRGMSWRKLSCTSADRFPGKRPQGIRKEARPLRRSARLQHHRKSQKAPDLLVAQDNDEQDAQV